MDVSRRVYDVEVSRRPPSPEPQGVGAWLPAAVLLFCAVLCVVGGLL